MKGIKAKTHFSYLGTVRQKSGEPLIDFLVLWRSEVAEVEGMDDKHAITMFIEALWARNLYKSLMRKAPIS